MTFSRSEVLPTESPIDTAQLVRVKCSCVRVEVMENARYKFLPNKGNEINPKARLGKSVYACLPPGHAYWQFMKKFSNSTRRNVP